jgi:hypothetical protein
MDNDTPSDRDARPRTNRRAQETPEQADPIDTARALRKATYPKTGTCAHCGRDMFNRRASARFCSTNCRTAACRKALPPPATREVQRLQTLVQHLEAENARLQALVQRLQAGKAGTKRASLTIEGTAEPLAQRLPSTGKERYLAAEAKAAKVLRAEERGRRAMRRLGDNPPKGLLPPSAGGLG